MSNITKQVITDLVGTDIANGINAIAEALGGTTDLTFKQIQEHVRAGDIDRYLTIGDEIVVNKETGGNFSVSHAEGSSSTLAKSSFDEEVWLSHIDALQNKIYEFKFDGVQWSCEDFGTDLILSYYGINTTGTPAEGDVIIVSPTITQLVFQYVAKDKVTLANPDLTHSAVFQLKNCYPLYDVQFSAPEAIIYASSDMNAGTYHFNLRQPNQSAEDGYIYYLGANLKNKDVQFTLTKKLAAGGQIVVTSGSLSSDSTVVSNLKLSAYAAVGNTSAQESNIACVEGTDGTDLGNANDRTNRSKVNSTDRCLYGSNKWSESSLRLWLNSDMKSGNWWSTVGRRFGRKPSSSNNSDAGFMHGIEKDFLAVLQPVKCTQTLNWFDYNYDSSSSQTVIDRFFVPSYAQVWMSEGTGDNLSWDYYKIYSDLSTAGNGADSNRIKYRGSTAKYWWLRTPSSNYSYTECYVNTTGANSYNLAYNPYGVAPACCIA